MVDITEIFFEVDNFCQKFEPALDEKLLQSGMKKRRRCKNLCGSEIMSILIWFHTSAYRDFKHFYFSVLAWHRDKFPRLPSYACFVHSIPSVLVALFAYLESRRGEKTGIQFIDSTSIKVCHNRRILRHRVFEDLAKRGKTTMGWFFGFKLHLIVNDCGELLAFKLTAGNTDDRAVLPKLCRGLFGKLFGDKGYISAEKFNELFTQGLQLVTSIKGNMKNKLMPMMDKILLRKRFLIETIIDQLKNISQIEHTRHRSVFNFLANLLCGLIAYTHQPKKPTLNLGLQVNLQAPLML